MAMTREQINAMRNALALAQEFADELESMAAGHYAWFDAHGNGPHFVLTTRQIREHVATHGQQSAGALAIGATVVDLDRWQEALDELLMQFPDAEVP